MHYTLCLPDLRCDFFELTDAKGGETYKRIPVAPHDLLLADRGYSNAPGVAAVRAAQGDVLVRWNSFAFPLKTMEGKPFAALKELRQLPKRGAREWAVCFEHAGKTYTGRLCAIRKNAVATARARKKLQQKASRRQTPLTPEALQMAEFVVVFTTVSRKVLDTDAVLELYRVRWQIELRFKHLKSLLGLGCLPKYDAQSCRAWIQAKLLCGLLVERLMREAKFFFPGDTDCLPPSHWREFIEARDAFISVVSRPLPPRQLVAHGAAIREGLKERHRNRTPQLCRHRWKNLC